MNGFEMPAGQLIGPLVAAQGAADRFAESAAISAIVPTGRRRTNGSDGRAGVWRFFLKVAFGVADCWFWVGARHRLGYGLFNGRKAHRASWEIHCGAIPAGMSVLHRCDVRNCVNPAHLFLGTQADNMRDMVAKGRHRSAPAFGEANPASRLTADQVREMRALRRGQGLSYRVIAERFGVTTMTAHRAINGTAWGTVS